MRKAEVLERMKNDDSSGIGGGIFWIKSIGGSSGDGIVNLILKPSIEIFLRNKTMKKELFL